MSKGLVYRLVPFQFELCWWRIRIFRRRSERFADNCLLERDRFGRGSVMVWGGIVDGRKTDLIVIPSILNAQGVVGWCEGAYLTSPGRPTELAYSWARPAILVVGKGRGGMFLFLLFLHFHSCSSFFPVPLFHLLYYLFYLFSPFFWETTQNDCR